MRDRFAAPTVVPPARVIGTPSGSLEAGRPRQTNLGRALALALPVLGLGAPIVWLGFSAGGFFAGTTGLAAVLAGLALVVWLSVADQPLGAVTAGVVAAVAAFAGFAVWTLVSSSWSGAPARALVEFDRALLYALVVLLGALACPGADVRRRAVWGFGAGTLTLVACGLITRILPHVWPIAPGVSNGRLSYPVTYWNTLGLLSAMGIVACLHLSASEREPVPVRIAAAGLAPVPVAALLFTFSRGAMLTVPVGVVAYLLLARPRGALGALAAIVPAAAVVVATGLGADALSSDRPTSPLAVSQGHTVALVVAACVVGAAIVRTLMLPVDVRVARLTVWPASARRAWAGSAVAVVVAAGAVTAAGAPGWVSREYHQFVDHNVVSNGGDRRHRLLDAGNNGRLDIWRDALRGYHVSSLHGTGAGTFSLQWRRYRPYEDEVNDGHSLYIEVLGELGIVGLALVVAGVVTLLVGTARRARGTERAVGAFCFAIVAMWALRAGIDWDWEMPVLTVPVLALGASSLGRRGALTGSRIASPPSLARLVAGLCCLLLVVTPALMAVSQRKLDAGLTAFRAGNCRAAIDDALSASSVLAVRPDPFELLGYCDARLGSPSLGVKAFDAALQRDPGDWQLYYGLAILRAADGLDPHAAVGEALERNPRSSLARQLARSLAGGSPTSWRRQARDAVVPF